MDPTSLALRPSSSRNSAAPLPVSFPDSLLLESLAWAVQHNLNESRKNTRDTSRRDLAKIIDWYDTRPARPGSWEVAHLVVVAATLMALVLGVACYACYSGKSPAKRSSRRARYGKLGTAPSLQERAVVFRLSPVRDRSSDGPNWPSMSLVNLLSNYPSSVASRDSESSRP